MRRSVVDLYYDNLEKVKKRVAVTDLFDELTYAELECRSNAICRRLLEEGVERGSLIPISMDHCIERAVAILGVMKAGAGYVLIQPEEWNKKKTVIARYISKRIVICEWENQPLFGAGWTPISPEMDAIFEVAPEMPVVSENALLCAHFTSGTTGDPKLVFLQHFDAYDMICTKNRLLERFDVERVAQYLSPYFAFGSEVYLGALAMGLSVYCFDEINRGNIPELFRFLRGNAIDMIELPTSLIHVIGANPSLADALPENLRIIIAAGESLYLSDSMRSCLEEKNIELFSEYGCSEMLATSIAPVSSLEALPNGLLPLGDPVRGCRCFLRDGHLFFVREGKKQQDYCVQRKELFVEDSDGSCYMDTMDLAVKKNHRIYITGRANRTVKVRGFRINLSEIEHCICESVHGVQVYVGCVEDKNHVTRIGVLYCSQVEIAPEKIKAAINHQLEDYKMPQLFVAVDTIPTNVNGKKDRERCSRILQQEFDVAGTPKEPEDMRALILWCVERYTGALDEAKKKQDFSELGIDSLTLISILCEIEEVSGISIQLEKLDRSWMKTPEQLIESVRKYELYR